MGENHFAPVPCAVYGLVLLMAAIAFYILQSLIIAAQGPESILSKAVGSDWKGKLSPVLYVCGVAAAVFRSHWISLALYVLVALLWLVPDRRSKGRYCAVPDGGETPQRTGRVALSARRKYGRSRSRRHRS